MKRCVFHDLVKEIKNNKKKQGYILELIKAKVSCAVLVVANYICQCVCVWDVCASGVCVRLGCVSLCVCSWPRSAGL